MKFYVFGLISITYLMVMIKYGHSMTEDEEWSMFKDDYGKSFKSFREETKRRERWRNTKKKVANHNSRFLNGEVSYEMEVNYLADMDDEELASLTGTKKLPQYNNNQVPPPPPPPQKRAAPPASFSWVTKGAVSPVQDQGQCGSCWSFASTGSLEGRYFIKYGKVPFLSEQQLVDCNYDPNYGSWGCDGGDYPLAIMYWNTFGFQNDSTYSYRAIRAGCKANSTNFYRGSRVSARCSKFNTAYNENYMTSILSTKWPAAIAINVQNSFFSYKSGIYSDPNCKNGYYDLNHAVLLVGYGTENGQDYWLVKNSWGTSWGINGYFKIARNANNMCGVLTDPCFIDFV